MPKIEILDTISTGTQSNMIGTPSSPGLSPVKWSGSVAFGIIILEDGSTYMKVLSGSSDTKSGLTVRTTYWPVVVLLGWSSFDVWWTSGESKWNYHVNDSVLDYGQRGQMTVTGSGDNGSAYWSFSESSAFYEGQTITLQDLSNDNWKKVANFDDWPNEAASITMYASCPVLSNMPTTVNQAISLDSYPLVINAESNPKLFKYYPWSRYNGGWQSLNRQGPETDSAGLHRFNGSWIRETNKPTTDTTADDHVHRYNGTSWVKSPKDS